MNDTASSTFSPGDRVRVRLRMNCGLVRSSDSSARRQMGVIEGHPAAMDGAIGVVIAREPRAFHAAQGHTVQVEFTTRIPSGHDGYWAQDSFAPDELEALS